MAFCKHCGAQVQDGTKFCPSCGKEVAETPVQQPVQQQPGYPAAPLTEEAQDIQSNKVMAVLAYILAPIPWFAAPNSKFARFHAKEGMKLFFGEIALVVLSIIFSFIKVRHIEYVWGYPVEYSSTPWFLNLIVGLLWIPVAILAIIGLVNAIQGKFKAPPFLDKIPLFKDK